MTLADALKPMADLYKKHVDENDKSGYADMLKACTESFFDLINGEVFFEDHPILEFKDVTYLDGYFIFGRGTNSIVHFRINDCPGWKFGIWWNVPDKPEETTINGEFFAQFEDAIDKFKPSRSSLCETIKISIDANRSNVWSAARMIRFIIDEPYLAFCRDLYCWNYNYEYHTREEAEEKFRGYVEHSEKEKKYTEILNKKVIDFVKEQIAPLFTDAEVKYHDFISPPYEVVAPLEKNLDYVDKPGFYGWFDDDDEDGREIILQFRRLIDECDKIADENDIVWWSPIHESIYIYEAEKKEIHEEEEKHES